MKEMNTLIALRVTDAMARFIRSQSKPASALIREYILRAMRLHDRKSQ